MSKDVEFIFIFKIKVLSNLISASKILMDEKVRAKSNNSKWQYSAIDLNDGLSSYSVNN